MNIVVVNLGVGNLHSVEQALKSVAPQSNVQISSDAEIIESADKIVLPGQGAMATWFASVEQARLTDVLVKAIKEKPILGICVGMQALFTRSEEGQGCDGMNLFNGDLKHFSQHFSQRFHQHLDGQSQQQENTLLKVPHIGWNKLAQTQQHPLWHNIDDNAYFYFVHSYCVAYQHQEFAAGTCQYGLEFVACIAKDNVFAVQFHPEKSHQNGLQLMRNFCQWDGSL